MSNIQPIKSGVAELKPIEYPYGYRKWAKLIDNIVYDIQSGMPPHDVASKYGVKYHHLTAIINVFGYKISDLRPSKWHLLTALTLTHASNSMTTKEKYANCGCYRNH